ncbi:selenium cofactor biosynthesis protein YqeC [Moorella sulfitireducens (nom. illeg.)]|uniref:selenium cofactor biosynthesis protein YqeC n=1 Tax=Neomoorella sulfitireducens TaxID=2972948 RepID=UPI0021AD1985|nr:selenium cofactor biosynthesis protein YqeC [Moorella sulfitireducens]
MRLYRALGLQDREIITVVGAGGKTSTIICLARELAALGRRVVVAPTTKMLLSQLRQLVEPVITGDTAHMVAVVAERLNREHLVTCGGAVNDQGKVTGLDAAGVTALASLDIDYLLLEGDGAAGALLKVPADHEPVIPPVTTLVVTVAGLPVLERPLATPFVHRPALAAWLLGKEGGSPVTTDDVGRLLVHPCGGRKGVPPGARWVVLLNQAESYIALQAGREIAGSILTAGNDDFITDVTAISSAGGNRTDVHVTNEMPAMDGNGSQGSFKSGTGVASSFGAPTSNFQLPASIDRVILGAVATTAPVRQVIMRQATQRTAPVGVVVLAAGAGERFGSVKQLVPIDGQPMVLRVAAVARAAMPGDVVVVLGNEADRVAVALEGLAVNIAFNPAYRHGLSTSLQAGLAALGPECQAALFVLADQPGVTPGVITRLCGAYLQERKKIVVPVYRGRRGNPVLIDRAFWPEIMASQGDVGAREIIRAHPEEVLAVEVDCPGVVQDIDTPAQYQAWVERK